MLRQILQGRSFPQQVEGRPFLPSIDVVRTAPAGVSLQDNCIGAPISSLIPHRRRQGQYGSHQRDYHVVNK